MVWWLLLAACFLYEPWPEDTGYGEIGCYFVCLSDHDYDGYCADDSMDPAWDCDDTDPEVHPGQVEVCNGIDDNCVDGVDEGFTDTDGDGIADCVDEG